MVAGCRARVAGLVVAVLAMILTAGCGLFAGGHDDGPAGAAPDVYAQASDEPAGETLDATPAETTPAPTPTRKKPARPKPRKTSATPTEDPNYFQLPDCARHEGTKVSKARAKSALLTAAGKTYWPTSAPKLRVSADLVKSVAWHESGWQSDIVNCDGGRGLMQVMPDTEAMINNRFGQSYVATDYRQNAIIGANYLAWLAKYFGDRYFSGSYDLSPGRCRTHASVCLLNMVIAGYNSGFGAVDATYASKKLPNPEYVNVVRALMTSCYCDRY